MADLVSYGIDAAVAVGTIGLTILTAYQLRRDRGEAIARELADRVYVPMRKVAIGWQNSEWHTQIPEPWPILKETVPYLTARVPTPLRELFEKARSIDQDVRLYDRPVFDLLRSRSLEKSVPIVRISKGIEPLGEVSMMNMWKSGKNLERYVADLMAEAYPLTKEWTLELWTDVESPGGAGTVKQKVGDSREAIDYTNDLLKFLASRPVAVAFQRRYRELGQVGKQAEILIDKELKKRVAPMSSSPVEEPGTRFG